MYHYKQVSFVSKTCISGIIISSAERNRSLLRKSVQSGILSLFMFLPLSGAVQAGDAWKDGWFGDLQIGGGVVNARPSGVEVLDDNEQRDSLTEEGSRVSEGLPLIGGEIGYGFQKTGTMVSAGGGIQDPWHVSFGQKIGRAGRIRLSALYVEEEVWENPYLTGVDRDRTDAASLGYAVYWDDILNTGLSAFAQQMQIDVDQDRIGKIAPDLRRDGTDTTLGVGYPWNLGHGGVLQAGIRYLQMDRDGDAESGYGYAAALNHVLEAGRFAFATGFELSAKSFDEDHPVFNEKREEVTFTVSETISFAEPFGLKNAYLFGLAAYSETDADLTFFDSSDFLAGSGVGYRF
jgi:hypothetical protein